MANPVYADEGDRTIGAPTKPSTMEPTPVSIEFMAERQASLVNYLQQKSIADPLNLRLSILLERAIAGLMALTELQIRDACQFEGADEGEGGEYSTH